MKINLDSIKVNQKFDLNKTKIPSFISFKSTTSPQVLYILIISNRTLLDTIYGYVRIEPKLSYTVPVLIAIYGGMPFYFELLYLTAYMNMQKVYALIIGLPSLLTLIPPISWTATSGTLSTIIMKKKILTGPKSNLDVFLDLHSTVMIHLHTGSWHIIEMYWLNTLSTQKITPSP